MHKSFYLAFVLTLLLLIVPLVGCETSTPAPSRSAVPPLPKEARQPPAPPECSPTCSQALNVELERLAEWLTNVAPPAPPASAPTTR